MRATALRLRSFSTAVVIAPYYGGATGVHRRHQNQLRRAGRPDSAARSLSTDLVRGGFQPRLPTSLPPPGQQQQPSPLPRRQPVPLMPPAQLHPGAPQVVAPAPAVPLQSPPPSELMDVDPSAGPPSQAVAVQPVLQPLSLGTPKESDTAAPCPAPTQQPSTQRQETLPLFVGPDAPSRPVPEAAPVVTGFVASTGSSECSWSSRCVARPLLAVPLSPGCLDSSRPSFARPPVFRRQMHVKCLVNSYNQLNAQSTGAPPPSRVEWLLPAAPSTALPVFQSSDAAGGRSRVPQTPAQSIASARAQIYGGAPLNTGRTYRPRREGGREAAV
ncbi:vegetative cell wall protein gp1-like [Schistocerca americana]|uniref:vegetative cell wall protein gp1-like n=1 Tax=Schistocerca americana TaxID=7009 RepID=UPI001F4F764F|nr:vegetative cell wall protein gp1-like [Schistocerca americana]